MTVHGLSDVVVVADAGMISEANMPGRRTPSQHPTGYPQTPTPSSKPSTTETARGIRRGDGSATERVARGRCLLLRLRWQRVPI